MPVFRCRTLKPHRTANNKNRRKKKSCYFTERDFAVGEKNMKTEGKVDKKEKARESRQTSLVGMVVVVTFMRVRC
jgi:hypothetical protein